MVNVRFELEGVKEAEAQAALLKTLRFYQQALQDVDCPTHGSKASLVVRGDGVQRLQVSIESCCETLARAAEARVRAVSRRNEDL